MARLSDSIEMFIKKLLGSAENGVIEIQRNELAQYFNCAPSQINYVLSTRFSSDKGYYIESRRGGGGYIKIVKVNINSNQHIRNVLLNIVGDSITKTKAYSIIDTLLEKGLISEREKNIMKLAINDRALNIIPRYKNELRANILKEMLLILLDD